MSEREGRDERYAVWWLPLFYFILILIGIAVIDGKASSELRDLQRRVGQLEQQVKQ